MAYPVSVKGVLLIDGKVVLVKNDRDEWELPGGRMDPGETHQQTLVREYREELSIDVEPLSLVDSYEFEVIPASRVHVTTYGCRLRGDFAPRISKEHSAFVLHDVAALDGLPLPEGYRRSIRTWVAMAAAERVRLRAATVADAGAHLHGARVTVWLRGSVGGLLLYLLMAAFTLFDFAFTPLAWHRGSGSVFAGLLSLLPLFLLAGAVAGWLARIGVRFVRYALVGAVAGGPVFAYLATAMPLTSRAMAEIAARYATLEAVLYGTLLGCAGGILLALFATIREWRNQTRRLS